MICKECHHEPSARTTEGWGHCGCKCHDIADAAPVAHKLLLAINEFFRHNNPVDPSALVLDDDRTLKQAVADYLATAEGRAP